MKNIKRNVALLAVVTVLLPSTGNAQNKPDTLKTTLENIVKPVGWNLVWEINRDYPVLKNGQEILESNRSIGSKLRLLTVSSEVNGEFTVWLCDSYKTLLVAEPQYVPSNKCEARLNTDFDRAYQ
ncbi:hypothetical protein [Vibrio anguillarum]|uniref:Uncharacterized protein n=1 Tax=Vibrio anguillarum TaxID=55601 RepID=A0ABR9Z7J0_VIBAN|nr:hypothetical protein [Vibrio anguillarum]MBF4374411.1 hypothetical protein [Vibrio anguillarum]